ncbi:hypothetical protein XENTR_v10022207 [Xenopus tropicalis]|nr:hypothetical protein XENTR_v10022207 [Xenopus tropicalis]
MSVAKLQLPVSSVAQSLQIWVPVLPGVTRNIRAPNVISLRAAKCNAEWLMSETRECGTSLPGTQASHGII